MGRSQKERSNSPHGHGNGGGWGGDGSWSLRRDRAAGLFQAGDWIRGSRALSGCLRVPVIAGGWGGEGSVRRRRGFFSGSNADKARSEALRVLSGDYAARPGDGIGSRIDARWTQSPVRGDRLHGLRDKPGISSPPHLLRRATPGSHDGCAGAAGGYNPSQPNLRATWLGGGAVVIRIPQTVVGAGCGRGGREWFVWWVRKRCIVSDGESGFANKTALGGSLDSCPECDHLKINLRPGGQLTRKSGRPTTGGSKRAFLTLFGRY